MLPPHPTDNLQSKLLLTNHHHLHVLTVNLHNFYFHNAFSLLSVGVRSWFIVPQANSLSLSTEPAASFFFLFSPPLIYGDSGRAVHRQHVHIKLRGPAQWVSTSNFSQSILEALPVYIVCCCLWAWLHPRAAVLFVAGSLFCV